MDVIERARRVGATIGARGGLTSYPVLTIHFTETKLRALIEAVQQEERERCAVICEQVGAEHQALHNVGRLSAIQGLHFGPNACAAAIRSQPQPESESLTQQEGREK